MINALGPLPAALLRPPAKGAVAGAQPPSVDPARVLDTSKLGFRVSIEVVDVDPNKISRPFGKVGWTATYVSDCSHGYKDSHSTYVKIESPLMHAGPDAWKTLHEVLQTASGAGAKLGNSGAMRVMVENKNLDIETHKALMRMQMACEPIIYKAARNGKEAHCGESGWNSPAAPKRAQGGYYFCTPPSANPVSAKSLSARTSPEMAQILAGGGSYVARHYGFQPFSTSQSGFSEFRYFTGTTDPDIVQADVEMILGMVKCAHEGRWPADVPPHAITDGKPVAYRTHRLFMEEVLGAGDTATRIDTLFKAAGGKVEPAPLDTPEMRGCKARLEQAGWRFEPSDLSGVGAKTKVGVLEPGQSEPYPVTGDDLATLLRIENGEGTAPNAALTARLREMGVAFFLGDATRPLMSRNGPTLAMAAGKLQAEFQGTRIDIAHEMAFSRFAVDTLSSAYRPQLAPEQQQAMADVQQLFDQKRIVVTASVPGHTQTTTLRSATSLPWLLSEAATVKVAGDHGVSGVTLADWPNLQRFGAAEARPSPATEKIHKLRDWGVEFHYVDASGDSRRAGLNSEVDEKLRLRSLKAKLPSWTWWNGLPRKNVKLKTAADMERLYQKFERKRA